MSLWWVPGIAGLWTLLIWGSRVRLLAGDESDKIEVWIRIVGSLLIGAAVLVMALVARSGGPGRWGIGIAAAFAIWMLIIWGTSAVNVLRNDHSAAFRIVHITLATISIALAVATLVTALKADQT